MPDPVTVATQAALDALLATNPTANLRLHGDGDYYISVGQPHIVVGGTSQPRTWVGGTSQPRIVVGGTSQPRIMVGDASQSRIVAGGTSQPRIWVGDASQPHIETWGTSQPRIMVGDASQPHIVVGGTSQPRTWVGGTSQPRIVGRGTESPAQVIASGDAHLVVEGHVEVHAAPGVYILATPGVVITGGHVRRRQSLNSVAAWCDYHGVPILDGVVTLYKAVRDDYRSAHGTCYAPGTSPVAADWDGGAAECGGGLHFCAQPLLAQGFDPAATRYVACPVAVVDLRVPQAGDVYPNKIKARAVCGPVVEVDEFGDPLEAR